MSYTSSTATAYLTLAGVTSPTDAVNLYIDWIANHEEDIPEELQELSAEELLAELLPYVETKEDGKVIISYDSEGDGGNYNSEYFDALTSYFKGIMTSRLMEVSWSVYDSRDGTSGGTDYYDADGQVQIEDETSALDKIAAVLSGTEWDADTCLQIAELIRSTGREVLDL